MRKICENLLLFEKTDKPCSLQIQKKFKLAMSQMHKVYVVYFSIY